MLESEIGDWVAHLHESRTADNAAAVAKKDEEVRKAKEAAAKAKQKHARGIAPVPGSGKSTSEKKRKPIVSVSDAEDDIMADVTQFVSQL